MAAKRTKSVCFRLSAEEHELLRQKARLAGLSQTALLRDHLNRTRIYNHKEKQLWFATLLSIRKLLAALAEKATGYAPADAVIATAYLAAIVRRLEQLTRYEGQHVGQVFPSRHGDQ
jgi:hypothetical protein